MGLKTNVNKTVGIVCYPCQAAGVRADEAYNQRVTGLRRSYKDRQRQWVNCPKCEKYLARGSMAAHRQTQNVVAKGDLGKESSGEGSGDETRTYRMVFPLKAVPRPCPVEECSGRAENHTAMCMHF